MKLDLDNYETVHMSVAETRALLDEIEDPLDLVSALDIAQSKVKSGASDCVYIIIAVGV